MTAMPASISTMDSPISSPDTKSCTSEPPVVAESALQAIPSTLLLAYSGSYVALMMVFMAQGTPVGMMLNYKYVAAEIVHTVVGSFGLVTVAPLTAITSGLLLTGKINKSAPQLHFVR